MRHYEKQYVLHSCTTSQVLYLAFCNPRAQPTEISFLMSFRSLRETLLKANRLELFSASSPCYLKYKMMPLRYPQNLVQMITSHYHTGSQRIHTSHLSTQHSSDHQPATGILTGLKFTCVFAAYWFTQPARGWGGRFREGGTLGDFPTTWAQGTGTKSCLSCITLLHTRLNLIAVTHFIQQFKVFKQKNLLSKAEIYSTCSFQKLH